MGPYPLRGGIEGDAIRRQILDDYSANLSPIGGKFRKQKEEFTVILYEIKNTDTGNANELAWD